jgi:glycosyltransferase involved in cell wall biosynthesis
MSIVHDLKLSVALAVFNEESNLGDCLESIKSIAQEIVIVDGGSTDKTVEIALRYGANVIQTDNPPIFHINKQKALDAACGRWILQLDADERVSKELAEEIAEVVNLSDVELRGYRVKDERKRLIFERHERLLRMREGRVGNDSGEVAAFFVPRANYFLGSFLRYGGVYPDGTIRLVRNGLAKFGLKDVHDQMEINGMVRWLNNDLIHMADPNFARYLARSNRYTSLQAQHWIAAKEKGVAGGVELPKSAIQGQPGKSWLDIVRWFCFEPLKTFLKIYVRHKGFLDRFPGLVWAVYSGMHVATSYVKYWEVLVSKTNLSDRERPATERVF